MSPVHGTRTTTETSRSANSVGQTTRKGSCLFPRHALTQGSRLPRMSQPRNSFLLHTKNPSPASPTPLIGPTPTAPRRAAQDVRLPLHRCSGAPHSHHGSLSVVSESAGMMGDEIRHPGQLEHGYAGVRDLPHQVDQRHDLRPQEDADFPQDKTFSATRSPTSSPSSTPARATSNFGTPLSGCSPLCSHREDG